MLLMTWSVVTRPRVSSCGGALAPGWVGVALWRDPAHLETNLREDFTITEEAPTTPGCEVGAFSVIVKSSRRSVASSSVRPRHCLLLF